MRVGVEFFPHFLDATEEIGADAAILLTTRSAGNAGNLWPGGTPSRTAAAPGRRAEHGHTTIEHAKAMRSTSAVKSTCPGVSMILMRVLMPWKGPTRGPRPQEWRQP